MGRRRGGAQSGPEALTALRPTGVVVFTEIEGVVMSEGTGSATARGSEDGATGRAHSAPGWKRRLLAAATWLLGR